MSITSLTFFLLVFITCLIYFVIPQKYRFISLLGSSLFFLFYDNFNLTTVIYVLIILLTSYFSSLLIYKYKDTKKSKLFMLIGVFLILGILIYLKYSNFILLTIQNIFNFFGSNITFNPVTRPSTIGLSYYSLIMIGYVMDVYRGLCLPQKNILKCALFMAYFPILPSGPFIRYNDNAESLYEGHNFSFSNLYLGLIRILWGLFKILVISERLAQIVNTSFNNPDNFSGLLMFLGALLFPLQLYTNFSGSIDLIMGVSKILGINLPENFTSPFFSPTITEFWRNWHITLGSYLKDYIFYPLMKSSFMQKLGQFTKKHFGKTASKKITLYLSMFIMWTLIGIWHGGAYTYIIGSGILQFIYMLFEDLLSPVATKVNNKLGINSESKIYRAYQILRTYLLFSFAMIFFRATSLSNAFTIIQNIFTTSHNMQITSLGLSVANLIILLIALLILFIIDKISIKNDILEKIKNSSIELKIVILGIFILTILTFGMYGIGFNASDFIYSRI